MNTNDKLKHNWLYIIIILMTGLISIILYMMISGDRNTRSSEETFSKFYYEENKERVKREVETRLEEINTIRSEIIELELSNIEREIKHIAFMLENLEVGAFSGDLSEENVIDYFDIMTSYNENLYFFSFDTQGKMLSHGNDESLVGIDFTQVSDKNGDYFIYDMLKSVTNEEGVSVSYYWPKNTGGESILKTSYCLYLEKYDLIVAAGVYHEDIEEKLKTTVFNSMQNYYEDRNDYIFVQSYDGIAEVTANRAQVGSNLSSVINVDGENVHDMFMNTIKQGGGFVTYNYYEKNSEIKSNKISYATEIPGWDNYIAMGFYTNDLDAVISDYSAKFKKQHYMQTLNIAVALTTLILIVFILLQRGQALFRSYMLYEEGLFTQLIQLTNDGVIVTNEDNQLVYQNKTYDASINKQILDYFKGNPTTIEPLNHNTIKVNPSLENQLFLEVTEKNIIYKAKPCVLHLIKNVTTEYQKINEYEKMSNFDTLTDLPNRRLLQSDFENIISNPKEQYNVIAIIDIDRFKIINDTYGHDFGDEVLIMLANIFKGRLRKSDKIYRYGGEEFIILLSNIDLHDAQKVINQIKSEYISIAKTKMHIESSFSGGLKAFKSPNTSLVLKDEVADIDRLLYKAKSNGRNRLEV